jgi:hypothetical protein
MEEMAEPVHFIPQQSQLTSPTFDHTQLSPGCAFQFAVGLICGYIEICAGG